MTRVWLVAVCCSLVLAWAGSASAQTTASLAASAAAEAERALGADRCVAEASELASAAARLRTEGDALLTRALTAYVTTLRTQLSTCMGPPPTTEGPRGRFSASADGADESGAGSFDMQAVVRMINTRRAAITRCYESELRSAPTLRGRVRVTFTIEESGSVVNVGVVESTFASAAVGACVVRIVEGFRFNPPPTDGVVTYAFPFNFEPVP
jgi:TonB family protein